MELHKRIKANDTLHRGLYTYKVIDVHINPIGTYYIQLQREDRTVTEYFNQYQIDVLFKKSLTRLFEKL